MKILRRIVRAILSLPLLIGFFTLYWTERRR